MRRVVVKRSVLCSVVLAVSVLAGGCGASTRTVTKTVAVSLWKDAQGYQCVKAKRDHAHRCPSNPNFGKTDAQVRAEAAAKAKAAAKAAAANRVRAAATAKAEAKAAAARRARAAARAKAAAQAAAAERARIAAENAWHQGYIQQDDNVYWKWQNSGSCQSFAEYGCWHVVVITRDGCASYVAVNANEYSSGGAIINSLLDNQGYGIPPKTSRVFELDADQSGRKAGDVHIDCS